MGKMVTSHTDGHKGTKYESHVHAGHACGNVFPTSEKNPISAFSGQTKKISVEKTRTGNID